MFEDIEYNEKKSNPIICHDKLLLLLLCEAEHKTRVRNKSPFCKRLILSSSQKN